MIEWKIERRLRNPSGELSTAKWELYKTYPDQSGAGDHYVRLSTKPKPGKYEYRLCCAGTLPPKKPKKPARAKVHRGRAKKV